MINPRPPRHRTDRRRQGRSNFVRARVEELLSTVESAARVACFTGDTTLASDVARGLLTNRLIAGVKITTGEQTLASASRYDGTRADGYAVLRSVTSPFNARQTVGQIELTADSNYIRDQAAEYSRMSSAALMLEVIAVACAVALVIMRRVVKPIRIFSDRTHSIQIDTGEHVLAPEGNADNEIDQLANDFNRMIGNMNALVATEQNMREEIALNERRFRTLVENTPDVIVRYDRECRLVFASRAYCRETGHRVEQMLGKLVGDGGNWRPELSVEDYCRRLRQVMSSGIPELIVLEWLRPDGQRVSHEIYVVAEYDADGQISGTLAIGRDVTERKVIERQLQHQASYDALTGLPNRRLFHERLRDEIVIADRLNRVLAVLFIDLDRFKEVNDTLGHSIGDQLLVLAAQRIQHCVRETDSVARLAGDEFVVIITNIDHFDPLERMAQDIVSGMSRPFHFGEHSTFVSASIGIAKYRGDADNAETLLGCADQAMYFAKESGRNSYRLFTVGMLEQAQYRLQLAADLREALSLGQLEMHYQPIFAIGNPLAVKEAIVAMAHRLRLRVIAEGVENLGQLELLEVVGCEYIQGYLFAKPMPRGQFWIMPVVCK